MTFHKYLGDSKMFEYEKHYKECSQLNKPFIKAKINPKHQNYFVQLDLLTCDYDLSKPEQIEIRKLLDAEIMYVQHVLKSDFNGFCIDEEIAWFDGISTKHVNTFCENLYDLTQKHHD